MPLFGGSKLAPKNFYFWLQGLKLATLFYYISDEKNHAISSSLQDCGGATLLQPCVSLRRLGSNVSNNTQNYLPSRKTDFTCLESKLAPLRFARAEKYEISKKLLRKS